MKSTAMKENDDEKIIKAPTSPAPVDESTRFISKLNDDDDASLGSQKVYKKTSSNQMLTLYLGSREITCRAGVVDPIKGVAYIDPRITETNQKVYCQVTLTFRYGREDEEVMGLKFCNEAIIAFQQIWPKLENEQQNFKLSPLQEALMERLGENSTPFLIELGSVTPPSVQLLPAKKYTGAPIGTSYDIRVYTVSSSEQVDERAQKRSTVRLGIRLIHKICPESHLSSGTETAAQQPTVTRSLRSRLSPKARKLIKQTSLIIHGSSKDGANNNNSNGSVKSIVEADVVDGFNRGPQGSVDKPFLWTEGRVNLKASLNKSAYKHGENVNVTIDVRNDSRKVVRKVRIFAVQHVDVCMFSNGKFKNIVAEVDVNKQISPGETLHGVYSLLPIRGATKNWIAVEGALFSTSNFDTSLAALNSKLASSAPRGCPYSTFQAQSKAPSSSTSSTITPTAPGSQPSTDDKNVFAIYVSYYVKVKLSLSGMGGEVTLKLPFILGNIENAIISDDKEVRSEETTVDLHLNDHQILNDIRRPQYDLCESCGDDEKRKDTEENSSNTANVNCKSMEADDEESENVNNLTLDNEGIDFINQKFSEMTRRNSNQSSDSSISDQDDHINERQEISVIQAQVHCQKYLESDI